MSMANLKVCTDITMVIIISMAMMVHGRLLRTLNTSDHPHHSILEDGFEIQHQMIHLSDSSVSSDVCWHIYGFFPCAYNVAGYIFQIIVYDYLLFCAEMFVTEGSDRLFQLFGTGIYGASIFRILKVLPGLITVIVTGLMGSDANASKQVTQGVSVYAGTTILNLTLLWLMCVIFGRKEESKVYKQSSSSSSSRALFSKENLRGFMESGIETDNETRYTAGVMLLSSVPFLVVEIVNFFSTYAARRCVILVALIVSTASLLAYFAYQVLNPWMQERSLENMRYENLLSGFLALVQRQVKGNLINEHGEANIPAVKSLFKQIDKDDDKCLTHKELQNLIFGFKFGKQSLSEIWKAFDLNNDGKIGENEFIEGFVAYINEAKSSWTTKDISTEGTQVPSSNDSKNSSQIEQLMSRTLADAHIKALEAQNLVKDDGTPNVDGQDGIRSLFRQYDTDGDKVISKPELEQVVQNVFDKMQVDVDETLKAVIKHFDKDGDGGINETEFEDGLKKLGHKAKIHSTSFIKKLLTWTFHKSVFQVILGIAMLTFLVAPLVFSIRQFSQVVGVPSTIVSFVIVPIALNVRKAILVIFPVTRNSTKTASLTFSEIYSGVITNNLMGLTTVLAILYAKDLRWNYSGEVMIIFGVCAVVGVFAFSRTVYPVWSCIIAFLLYPLSLGLFYVLHYVLHWH